MILQRWLLTLVTAAAPAAAQTITHTLLSKFPDGIGHSARLAVVANGGKSVAIPVREAGEDLVYVNGIKGPAFDRIVSRTLMWSPDGKKVSYVGQRGSDQFLVLDGAEQRIEGRLAVTGFSSNPSWNAAGTSLTWITVSATDKASIYENGTLIATADKVPYLTQFGQGFLRMLKNGCETTLSTGTTTKSFVSIGLPLFDATRTAYVYEGYANNHVALIDHHGVERVRSELPFRSVSLSKGGSKTFAVLSASSETGFRSRVEITGLPTQEFEGESSLVESAFSPRGDVIFAIGDGESVSVVRNSTKMGTYSNVISRSLAWSIDGDRYAYAAETKFGEITVFSSHRPPSAHPFVFPGTLQFGPLGKVVFQAADAQIQQTYLVTDGVAGPSFNTIDKTSILSNGSVLYLGTSGSTRKLVIDGRAFPVDWQDVYPVMATVSDDSIEVPVRRSAGIFLARIMLK